MRHKNRELEVKLQVTGRFSYGEVVEIIKKFSKQEDQYCSRIRGASSDLYWKAHDSSKADFVRLRNDGEKCLLTVKGEDLGHNIDRVEIDIPISDPKQGLAFASFLLDGEPTTIHKTFDVFFLNNGKTAISVYRVRGDGRVFVEVETGGRTELRGILRKLEKGFPNLGLKRVDKSLFDIFVLKSNPKLIDLSSTIRRLL